MQSYFGFLLPLYRPVIFCWLVSLPRHHYFSWPSLGQAHFRWSSKASRCLNFIRRSIYSCSPDVKSLAYTSLVRPILEYATAAWDPYRAKDVQRRAARFVKRDYRQTTSVLSLLDQLGWPSLSDRRLNNCLKIFGKTVAGRVAIKLVIWLSL